MGMPEAMYDPAGAKVWSCELNSYGKVRKFQGEYKGDCPFRYQGQYHDPETGLHYNRFRYYSPEEGMYISQDPVRLLGGHTLYSYVSDTNGWTDIWGLKKRTTTIITGANGDELASGTSQNYTIKDPNLQDTVDRAKAKWQSNHPGEDIPGSFGNCGEIVAIDAYLSEHDGDASGLWGALSDARYGNSLTDFDDKELKEACDCCEEVLAKYGITDKNKDCGGEK